LAILHRKLITVGVHPVFKRIDLSFNTTFFITADDIKAG